MGRCLEVAPRTQAGSETGRKGSEANSGHLADSNSGPEEIRARSPRGLRVGIARPPVSNLTTAPDRLETPAPGRRLVSPVARA